MHTRLRQLGIFSGSDAHKHAGAADHARLHRSSARRQRLARRLQQQALLRVHQARLVLADGKGPRIKQVNVGQEDGEPAQGRKGQASRREG